MTCANHPDRENSAFCQNCGKPLCPECTRIVGSAVFCEPCLAAKISGATPPSPSAGWQPVNSGNANYNAGPIPPINPGGPNPGLAAMLGFIPGVGAMYNGQFAKGIVHLGIFAVLISLSDHVSGVFGIFIAGWVFYMVFDAYQTAKARRDGTPLPDPFGLNDVGERFGVGKSWPANHATGPYTPPVSPDPAASTQAAPPPPPPSSGWASNPYANVPPSPSGYGMPPVTPMPPVDPNWHPSHRLPIGAIWLIALGAIFLVANIGMFGHVSMNYLWPFLMIGFGVWIFIKRMMRTGTSLSDDGSANYRWRLINAFQGAMWIILSGILWLLDSLRILRWSNSWPVFIIAIGLLTLAKRAAYGSMNTVPFPPQQPVPTAWTAEPTIVPPSEPIHNGEENK